MAVVQLSYHVVQKVLQSPAALVRRALMFAN